MSSGIICDKCGTALPLDEHGEDEDGEVYAWLHMSTKTGLDLDACTLSCARELLDDEKISSEIAERLEPIAAVSQAVKQGRTRGGDGRDDG
jgi:hypothetical protein